MKKKIFLFCLIALLFTGCSSNSSKVYDEIESSGYGVGWGGNPDGIVCNEIKDALYVDNNFFISNNGKVYKLNMTKLFSNEKNCIIIDSVSNARFAYGPFIYDENYNIVAKYSWKEKDILTDMEKIKADGQLYVDSNGNEHIENALIHLEFDFDFDFISSNDCTDDETLYIKDNKIYAYKHSKTLYLGEIPSEEDIIYMNGTLIKTNKNFYQLVKTNEEECNKYVDVKCTYGFVKSDLSKIYNKIIYASQDYVIDDNYRVYVNGRCFGIDIGDME